MMMAYNILSMARADGSDGFLGWTASWESVQDMLPFHAFQTLFAYFLHFCLQNSFSQTPPCSTLRPGRGVWGPERLAEHHLCGIGLLRHGMGTAYWRRNEKNCDGVFRQCSPPWFARGSPGGVCIVLPSGRSHLFRSQQSRQAAGRHCRSQENKEESPET
ncbi:hypothetical protein M427DRAFT_332542 [Gonapodya prolifera JEL478]|uniref:Uncharacterized protein n=1 Tax=Gonapodya prolifera (strain JEL478) TaxID=1344416 RepID=A0A139ADW4_GONPJ|nr:hypothetical protein M427DRAFT_332542 [Gonapodya prolifera JEL478]|eukprot:KXS14950.1 hypothetical protein M427DRAFT_332542 [Gonapodya prolifera JEL478]